MRIAKYLEIVFLPLGPVIAVLNNCAALTGAVWLAILGHWALIGVAVLLFFFCTNIVGLAIMPGMLFVRLAAASTNNRFLSSVFICCGLLYNNLILTIWGIVAVLYFVKSAGTHAVIPALLLAYGIAITPPIEMAQSPAGRGNPSNQETLATVCMEMQVIAMSGVILMRGIQFQSLIVACAIPLVVIGSTECFLAHNAWRYQIEEELIN